MVAGPRAHRANARAGATVPAWASLQVSYSLVDRRPEYKMVPFCRTHGIQLLTYGTLLGGLLTDRWVGTFTAGRPWSL